MGRTENGQHHLIRASSALWDSFSLWTLPTPNWPHSTACF